MTDLLISTCHDVKRRFVQIFISIIENSI